MKWRLFFRAKWESPEMLFLCSDNCECALCKESPVVRQSTYFADTDVVQVIALVLLYLLGPLSCWEGEFWGAGGGRSCAKPAKGAWAEQPQLWHREGEERSSSSLLGSPLGSNGRRWSIAGGWMKELLKKYQISPDLSQWLLKWKVCSITVNGQAFIILCY